MILYGLGSLISGGLHLDGFGDSCDGLLAAVKPEERRRIMRDPRAGMWAIAGTSHAAAGKMAGDPALRPPKC